MCSFESLPGDLLHHTFQLLSAEELDALEIICSPFFSFIKHNRHFLNRREIRRAHITQKFLLRNVVYAYKENKEDYDYTFEFDCDWSTCSNVTRKRNGNLSSRDCNASFRDVFKHINLAEIKIADIDLTNELLNRLAESCKVARLILRSCSFSSTLWKASLHRLYFTTGVKRLSVIDCNYMYRNGLHDEEFAVLAATNFESIQLQSKEPPSFRPHHIAPIPLIFMNFWEVTKEEIAQMLKLYKGRQWREIELFEWDAEWTERERREWKTYITDTAREQEMSIIVYTTLYNDGTSLTIKNLQ